MLDRVAPTEAQREKATLLEILGADGPARRGRDRRRCPTTSTWWSPRRACRRRAPLLAAAARRGVPVWGEVELAWRLRDPEHPGAWLCVTGTNGKTTTVQMLDAILGRRARAAVACGNVGLPIVEAVMDPEPYDVLRRRAVQLPAALHLLDVRARPPPSSTSPRTTSTGTPARRMADYAADKGRIYERRPARLRLQRRRPGHRAAGPRRRRGRGRPRDRLHPRHARRRAWSAWSRTCWPTGPSSRSASTRAAELCTVADLRLAGAALRGQRAGRRRAGPPSACRPSAVRDGLRAFTPDGHRIAEVAEVAGVRYVDDSKATNPHAAAVVAAGLRRRSCGSPAGWPRAPRSTSWSAGVRDRLRGVVLLGRDRAVIAEALARHAPDVPVIEVDGGDTVRHGPRGRGGGGARPAGRHRAARPRMRVHGHVRELRRSRGCLRRGGPPAPRPVSHPGCPADTPHGQEDSA